MNISSAGVRSCPIGTGHYVATKAALEALTAALRKEVAPLGITVMTVEPGAFRIDLQALPRPAPGGDQRLCQHRGRPQQGRHHRGRPPARGPCQGSPGDHRRRRESCHVRRRSSSGLNALTWFRDAMKELSADVDAWEQTSLSTSFPRLKDASPGRKPPSSGAARCQFGESGAARRAASADAD